MITMIREITIRGDEFGKNKDSKGRAYNLATRKFIITVNGVIDVTEIYEALPELGDLHPLIAKCRVDDVKVTATNDPNVWEATVHYETFDPELTSTIRRKEEEEEEEEEPEEQPVEEEEEDYPWLQPAAVTFSSDASQTQAMEYCYAEWDVGRYITGEPQYSSGPAIAATSVLKQSDNPVFRIVNKPLGEKFASVPEEPIACLAINISFAMKGFANMTIEGIGKHDNTSVLSAVNAEFFTVNKATTTVFGYRINPCCGYVSSINMERSYYTDKQRRKWAYFQITIQILNNPETWIRRIENLSKNMFVTDPVTLKKTISPILLYNVETGLSEPVLEPVPVYPADGTPIHINSDGVPYPGDRTNCFLIPVLTKRPSYWTELLSILNQVAARV
jgi:hypothetical protein